MTLSVIICTCNRYEAITRTIDSILANDIEAYELIIIDQSDDQTRMQKILNRYVKRYPVKYIRDDGKGLSRARNIGIEHASGNIIAFTDDDAFVDKNWIRSTIHVFELSDYNVGVAGGKIIPVYEEINPEWKIPERWEYFLPSITHDSKIGPFDKGLPAGANICFARKVFEVAGRFDENLGVDASKKIYLCGEDSDMVLKARSAGFDIIYNPESVVYHPVPLSRQNQGFLNRRCFIEGATQEYIKLKEKDFGVVARLWRTILHVCGFMKLLAKMIKLHKVEYLGHFWYLRGRLFMIFNHNTYH